MKLGKRFLSLLLVVVMCISLIACGNQPSAGNETPDPTKEQTPAVENNQQDESTEPVVENLTNAERFPIAGDHKLTIGVGKEGMENSEIFAAWAEAVGYEAEYKFYTPEQVPLAFAAEEIPDIFFATNALIGLTVSQINDYGEAGMLVNLMDHLDEMPNLKRVYEEHPERFATVMTPEGAVYTMPYYSVTLTGFENSMYYRVDHMKKAGWETAPETIEDFTEFLRDLKTTFADVDGYYPLIATEAGHMRYNDRMSDMLFPAFGELLESDITVDANGNVVAGFTTEQYQRYLKYINSLIGEGLLDPNCLTAVRDIMNAVQTNDQTSVGTVLAQLKASQFESGVIEASSFVPFTSQYVSEKRVASSMGANFWGGMISSKCEDLEAALAFVDACYAPIDDPINEEGTLWSISWYLGELNVAWEWVEEGVSYVRTAPEGYDSGSAYSAAHGYSTAPYIGDWLYTEIRDGVPRWNAECIRVNSIPYLVTQIRTTDIVLNDEEAEVVNDYLPDIKTYVEQMSAAFISGEANVDTDFAGFVANLEAMGLQDVLDAYQSAYDRMY